MTCIRMIGTGIGIGIKGYHDQDESATGRSQLLVWPAYTLNALLFHHRPLNYQWAA